MSRFKTAARAAVAALLISDAAAALCARRSVTASLIDWIYEKAAGGAGGAPFIMVGSTPFSPSEMSVLASPCFLGVALAVLFCAEITDFLARCFALLRHRHEAADSLPTISMSSDELFHGRMDGAGADGGAGPDPEGQGGDGGRDDEPDDGGDEPDGGEYPGGWFDEEGWHDDDVGDEAPQDGSCESAQDFSRTARADAADDGAPEEIAGRGNKD